MVWWGGGWMKGMKGMKGGDEEDGARMGVWLVSLGEV